MPRRREPARAATYVDARGERRAMRVSWHLDDRDADDGLVVVSLWRENVCTATFRLALAEVPGLVALLCDGVETALRTAPGSARVADAG